MARVSQVPSSQSQISAEVERKRDKQQEKQGKGRVDEDVENICRRKIKD